MKNRGIFLTFSLLFVFAITNSLHAQEPDNPPQGLQLLFAGAYCPSAALTIQEFPNAKHISNVIVGSYYFPTVIYETSNVWGFASMYMYWDDMFSYWSYPDSFTTGGGDDTGGGNVWADSHGNLHLAWHQAGNSDGYEVFYTRALLDTSAGVIQFNVQRPGEMVSETNGLQETYPSLCVHNDNPYVVWSKDNVLYWNYSSDGGVTWNGPDTAFVDSVSVTMGFVNIAPDPTSNDVWVTTAYNTNNDTVTDIVAFHYLSGSGTWEKEVVAVSPDSLPYAQSAIAVDYLGRPNIVFQRYETYGSQAGPVGQLLFSRKVTSSWSSPETLRFGPDAQTDNGTGWPSLGITETNEIYVAFTQDSAGSGYQVFYSKVVPDQGIFNTPRRIVSKDDVEDSLVGGAYPHLTYYFPDTGSFAGPGITFCSIPIPSINDLYYKHMELIPTGVEEGERDISTPGYRMHISPSPFREKTEISLSRESDNQNIRLSEIQIYDLSGRVVRNLEISNFQFPISVEWRGEDNLGNRVQCGVYFVRAEIAGRISTKKIILID
jgi:hypothetical protein